MIDVPLCENPRCPSIDRNAGVAGIVDSVIRSLRKKLGDQAYVIETVTGVGYRYRPG